MEFHIHYIEGLPHANLTDNLTDWPTGRKYKCISKRLMNSVFPFVLLSLVATSAVIAGISTSTGPFLYDVTTEVGTTEGVTVTVSLNNSGITDWQKNLPGPPVTQSDTTLFHRNEGTTVLASDLDVNFLFSDEAAQLPFVPTGGTIAAGTTVTSHFFHIDSAADSEELAWDPNSEGTGGVDSPITIQFTGGEKIIGFIYDVDELNASDSVLAPGITFSTGLQRKSITESNDEVYVAADGFSFYIGRMTQNSNSTDQFRVLTVTVPEPATVALLLGAIGGFAVVLRGRKHT